MERDGTDAVGPPNGNGPARDAREMGYRGRRRSWRYPRPRLPWPVAVALALTVLGLVWVGVAASIGTRTAAPASYSTAPAPPDPLERDAARIFATVKGLLLYLPYPDPLAIAFHEASKPEALRLEPNGSIVANDNPTKFTSGEDHRGPAYRVLSSRGRHHPATSAVDIVVPEGSLIRSPVTGTVAEVRQYPLYSRGLDWRVAIAPDSHPDLQVILIHLEDPQVSPGDEVVAGITPLAAVRLLPFASHVDYVIEQHKPHTHIEVKEAPEDEAWTEPLDPNTRAVAPVDASGDANGDPHPG